MANGPVKKRLRILVLMSFLSAGVAAVTLYLERKREEQLKQQFKGPELPNSK